MPCPERDCEVNDRMTAASSKRARPPPPPPARVLPPEFLRSYVLDKKLEHRVFTEVFQANARGTQQGFQPYRVKRTTRWGLPKEDEDRLLEEVRGLRVMLLDPSELKGDS